MTMLSKLMEKRLNRAYSLDDIRSKALRLAGFARKKKKQDNLQDFTPARADHIIIESITLGKPAEEVKTLLRQSNFSSYDTAMLIIMVGEKVIPSKILYMMSMHMARNTHDLYSVRESFILGQYVNKPPLRGDTVHNRIYGVFHKALGLNRLFQKNTGIQGVPAQSAYTTNHLKGISEIYSGI